MAQLQQLPISADRLPQVVEQFERLQKIAQPVLAFELPDELEAAPRFEP
ncbi:MAG: DUF4089 domain-containing protein [Leptolyngbya sp. SIO4C1]|nr:DUF4089 domain-containing protein [Leptolyngbya sp. SIO4C1]